MLQIQLNVLFDDDKPPDPSCNGVINQTGHVTATKPPGDFCGVHFTTIRQTALFQNTNPYIHVHRGNIFKLFLICLTLHKGGDDFTWHLIRFKYYFSTSTMSHFMF